MENIAIPDIDVIVGNILKFAEYICSDDMQKLEENNKKAFEKKIEDTFKIYESRYLSMYKLLMDKENREENLFKLIQLLKNLKDVKEGVRDLETVTNEFGESLREEFIYSKFGGKEKFEKTMEQRAKNKKKG